MFNYSVLFCLLFCFSTQVKGQITCPSCSNGYDPTSCTLTQHCHNHDVCELHVHLADHNRIEYICHNSHACTNQETHPCSATHHEVCTFCCNSIQSCQQEREHLFTDRFTAAVHTAPTTTQPPTDVTTHSTTHDTTHTSTEAPMHTTSTTPITTTTTTTTSTTTTDAVTDPPTTTSSSTTIYRCVKCDTEPCDEAEIANQPLVHCPTSHPYCYTETVQTNSRRSVSKGCADQTFCRTKWWDYSAVSTLCEEPYLTSSRFDFECTFCCEGEYCNRDERPADNTLVSF